MDCLVLGVCGVGTFIRYYNQALPIASLNFKLTRAEAYQKAEAYVQAMGYETQDYKSAQVLDSAGLQQVFLERSLGCDCGDCGGCGDGGDHVEWVSTAHF